MGLYVLLAKECVPLHYSWLAEFEQGLVLEAQWIAVLRRVWQRGNLWNQGCISFTGSFLINYWVVYVFMDCVSSCCISAIRARFCQYHLPTTWGIGKSLEPGGQAISCSRWLLLLTTGLLRSTSTIFICGEEVVQRRLPCLEWFQLQMNFFHLFLNW